MRSGLRVAAAVVVTCTLFSVPARADQIALTSGLIDWAVFTGLSGGFVRLSGDRGFTFDGNALGSFDAVGNPMPPGSSLTLNGQATDVRGTLTLDGSGFPDVGGPNSTATAMLRIATSPVILPSPVSPPAQVTAPFVVDFLFFTGGSQPTHTLSGVGTARISLAEDLGFGVPSWRVTRFQGEVSGAAAPIPEPATLLLIGSGLGWVAVRRRHRRVLSGNPRSAGPASIATTWRSDR